MNVIELVTKMLPLLDEQYVMGAKTSILDAPAAFVQETRNAKTIKIAKINVDGLGSYDRNTGFTVGYSDLTWEERTFTQDRGRAIQIDAMDNEETFGLAFGRLAGTFQERMVIPEIDAYRFSKYYQSAGTKVEIDTSVKGILKWIDDIDTQMDDDEVPEENRIIFTTPTGFNLIANDPDISRYIDVRDTKVGSINKKIYYYNDHPLIKVPSKRFYTEIKLLSGKEGEAAGGYEAASDAKTIGLIMIHPSAVLQAVKRNVARIWAPNKELAAGTDGVNPNADAWKFDFRIYHDVFDLDEKVNAIAAATFKTPAISSVDITTTDKNISLGGSAGARTATVTTAKNKNFKLDDKVAATGGASTVVNWESSDRNKAVVDGNGNVTLVGTGSATITCKSAYNPSKKATLTLTIS